MSVTDALLAYSFAALLLTLTPGLDTALILRTATVESRKKAFHAALGINTGCFIWGALVAFGLGALLAASELGYNLLKWCGAAYLCWLGLQLILKPRRQLDIRQTAHPSSTNWFIKGIDSYRYRYALVIVADYWHAFRLRLIKKIVIRSVDGSRYGRRFPVVCRQAGVEQPIILQLVVPDSTFKRVIMKGASNDRQNMARMCSA